MHVACICAPRSGGRRGTHGQGTGPLDVARLRGTVREARDPVVLLVYVLPEGEKPGARDERAGNHRERNAGAHPEDEEGARRSGPVPRDPRLRGRPARRMVRVRAAGGVPEGRSGTILQEAQAPGGTPEALADRVHGRLQGPSRAGGGDGRPEGGPRVDSET